MKAQIFALLAAVGAALAQGVTGQISPKGDSPAGCKPTSDGKFEIAIVELNNPAKRNLALQNRATCSGDGILVAQLSASVLTDDHARTGYIASNYQFQFDAPPQAGALYTAGFSQCANGSLALGSSTVFYQCRSGSFYNLYDRWWADQCEPVEIIVMPCGGGAAQASGGGSGGGGETVVGTQIVTTTVVAPLGDGQPQVVTTTTAVLICQIGDGQIQGHTTPCSGAPTIQTSTPPSVPPISQYSDGQIQVTPAPAPSGSNGNGGGGGVTVTVPSSSSETAGGNTTSSTASAPPGVQVTSSASVSVPTGVPTSAPSVSEAAAGGGGGRIPLVVMVGLGVAGMVWGW